MKGSDGAFLIYDADSDDWTKEPDHDQASRDFIELKFEDGLRRYLVEMKSQQSAAKWLEAAVGPSDEERIVSGISRLQANPTLKSSTALLEVLGQSEAGDTLFPFLDPHDLPPVVVFSDPSTVYPGVKTPVELMPFQKLTRIKNHPVLLNRVFGVSDEEVRGDLNKRIGVGFSSGDGYESSH
jgi:hypothetical protein